MLIVSQESEVEDRDKIKKFGTVKNLSAYWNPNATPLSFSTQEEMGIKLKEFIVPEEDKVDLSKKSNEDKTGSDSDTTRHLRNKIQYIVHPITTKALLMLSKGPATKEAPKVAVDMFFDRIHLSLSDAQYKNILNLVDHFLMLDKRLKVNHSFSFSGLIPLLLFCCF